MNDFFDNDSDEEEPPSITSQSTDKTDSMNLELNNDSPRGKLRLCVSITNARSLAPKINSLIDNFSELDLHFSKITESWLREGQPLRDAVHDLNAGCNLDMLTHNRPTKNGRRTAGGGITFVYNRNRMSMRELKVRKGKSEMLVAVGKILNVSRKLMVIGIYLSPKMKAEKRKEAMGCLRDAIATAKNDFRDPYIVIAGDTNKMSISGGIENYPDVSMNLLGPQGDWLNLTFWRPTSAPSHLR